MKHTITITFETADGVDVGIVEEIANDCFVQLEGLTDDHEISYKNANLEYNMVWEDAQIKAMKHLLSVTTKIADVKLIKVAERIRANELAEKSLLDALQDEVSKLDFSKAVRTPILTDEFMASLDQPYDCHCDIKDLATHGCKCGGR